MCSNNKVIHIPYAVINPKIPAPHNRTSPKNKYSGNCVGRRSASSDVSSAYLSVKVTHSACVHDQTKERRKPDDSQTKRTQQCIIPSCRVATLITYRSFNCVNFRITARACLFTRRVTSYVPLIASYVPFNFYSFFTLTERERLQFPPRACVCEQARKRKKRKKKKKEVD